MAAEIPSSIPSEIRAGDTVRWRRELSAYPASEGWQLHYAFVGTASVQSAVAAADGDAHLVTLAANVTAGWPAGTYRVQEYVTKGTERYSLSAVNVRVLPDLTTVTTGADLRTHARKVLDAIEGWLESKAPAAQSIEIAGRKISNYPIADLLALRDRYRAEVAREEAAASGAGRGSRLLVRF